MSTIDFAGQVVLVTGAGRGLGAAYALLLGSHDAVVAVHDAGVGRDRTGADPGLARGVRDAVVSGGGTASAHLQDLATRSGCEDLVAEVLDTHGRIDALVHNAGIVRYLRIAETSEEEWRRTMAVNVDAGLVAVPSGLAGDGGRWGLATWEPGEEVDLGADATPDDLLAWARAAT